MDAIYQIWHLSSCGYLYKMLHTTYVAKIYPLTQAEHSMCYEYILLEGKVNHIVGMGLLSLSISILIFWIKKPFG